MCKLKLSIALDKKSKRRMLKEKERIRQKKTCEKEDKEQQKWRKEIKIETNIESDNLEKKKEKLYS